MRIHKLLALALVLTSPLAVATTHAQNGVQARAFDSAAESSMLERINALRAERGLSPLSRSSQLDLAAQVHTADMVSTQALTHVSQATGTPADRVQRTGVSADNISENVALHGDAASAQDTLEQSEAHLANMLRPELTHVGLAAMPGGDGVYITQLFATLAEPSLPEASPEVAPAAPLPPPSSSQVAAAPAAPAAPAVAPAPAPAPPVAEAAPAPAQRAVPQVDVQLTPQAGSNQTVLIERSAGRVSAYWVYGNGRWWYYPMPRGATPGQQLAADRSVTGPPPGYPAHPRGVHRALPPQARPLQARPMVPVRPAPVYRQPAPVYRQPAPVYRQPARGQIVIRPGVGAYYHVPPPPLVGRPTRAWRRAYRHWERARRRYLRRHRVRRRL